MAEIRLEQSLRWKKASSFLWEQVVFISSAFGRDRDRRLRIISICIRGVGTVDADVRAEASITLITFVRS